MFNKKTWKDRISQYPNRRTINDGIISKNVTVSRNEGTVTEAGDSFNAANMNDLEDRINEAFTNIVHMPRINNKAPYQYRQTPVKADRCIEKLIGCSCAFNQLANSYRADASYAGITLTNYSDYVHLQGITTAEDNITILNVSSGIIPSGHKFLAWLYGINSNDCKIVCGSPIMSSNYGSFAIIGSSTALSMSLALGFKSGVSIDNDVRVNCIDLTALFGSSEVADYFYNLETQTAGAGVAKFRQLFPESYYAYQTATLISAKPVAKKVVGKNLFDEDTILQYYNFTKESDGSFYSNSFNSILNESLWENNIGYDGTIYLDYDYKYQNSTGSAGIRFSIEYEDGYISASSPSLVSTFTHFQRVSLSGHGKVKRIFFDYGTSNNATWLKNVSVTFEDSDYEPYEEHTYPLGSDEIRGIFKIENGELVAYGDVHNSDGTGVKYFGIVDLGSLDWDYQGNNRFTPVQDIGAKIQSSTTVVANILCDTYTTVAQGGIAQDKIIAGLNWGNGIIIHDTDYSDTTDFKTAMSGKYLIYELATPTSETYTAFSNPMLCGSTEEFTDSRTVKMPCGHYTQYYTETEGDKLSALPEVTGEQGDFIINNVDGKMTLKKRNVYSETEKVVGTWIDGKPIYEKTFSDTFASDSTTLAISAGYGVLAIIEASGFLLSSDLRDSVFIGGGNAYFDDVTENGLLVKRTNVYIGGSTPTAYVTVRYIKS